MQLQMQGSSRLVVHADLNVHGLVVKVIARRSDAVLCGAVRSVAIACWHAAETVSSGVDRGRGTGAVVHMKESCGMKGAVGAYSVRVCLSVNHRNSSGSCIYPLPATSLVV